MVSLIKLQNGTEMVGEISHQTNTHVTVKDPLQINYRMVTTQPMPVVSISRYMPFAENTTFIFEKAQLLHLSEPKEAMCSYYSNALHNYRAVVDRNVDKELQAAADMYNAHTKSKTASHLEDFSDPDLQEALLERLTFKGHLN